MDNQGIAQRTSLGFKNTSNRHRIKGIPSQSIDGLRWHPYDTPLPQKFDGITNPLLSMNNPGSHLEKTAILAT